jgi:glycosyltransferase involved in cell wall biosynthesis
MRRPRRACREAGEEPDGCCALHARLLVGALLRKEMLPESRKRFEVGGSIHRIACFAPGVQLSVSVVIPCYNQGRFVGEAVASAAAQRGLVSEIVVVDDGSTDETTAVATRDGSVRYLRQERRGLSEARNSGWRASSGDYVIFLDADDRLLPDAAAAALEAFRRWPHAAFVFGHYELIDERGTVLPTWRELRVADDRTFTTGDFELVLPDGRRPGRSLQPRRVSDHYTAMLRRNYISMHAAVVYRRAVLEETGGFDPRLSALEDYELYLRVTRMHPVACHDQVVAQYRRHPAAMSRDTLNMLRMALFVLREQRRYLSEHPGAIEAYEAGLTFWKRHYGKQLMRSVPSHLAAGRLRQAGSSCAWSLALAVGGEPRAALELAGVA